nr:hypothetical protein [Octadecabacter arcticus]
MARIVWALIVKKTFIELWLRRRKPTDSREDVGAEEGKELYGATVVRRDWENRKHTGNPLFFWHDLRCDYCAKLAIWLARYEDFDDEQD